MLWFFSVRLRAMPYRHFLFAPMVHQGDDHLARMFLFGRLYVRGSLLFHSTAGQNLRYYRAFMSEAPYTLVPMGQKWIHYGTAWDYDNAVDSSVTLASMVSLCGPVYSEGYVFDDNGGGVDLYLRLSSLLPTSLYYHYRLNVEDYRLWMEATWYEFLGIIERPEWAWTASMRL